MANDNVHIIRKVSAEMVMPSSKHHHAGERLRIAIQEAVKNMDSLLDEHFGDALYRMELLSVELQLQQTDMPRLAELLEKAFIRKIRDAEQVAQDESSGKSFEHKIEQASTGKFEKLAPEQQAQKLLIHFLKTGQFPWWAGQLTLSVLEDELRGMSTRAWLEAIKPLAQNNYGVVKRIAAQFPEKLIWQLIKKSSDDASTVNEFLSLLQEIKHFLGTQELGYGRRQQTMTLLYERALAGMLLTEPHNALLGDLMALAIEHTEAETAAWLHWLEKADTNKDEWLQVWKEHGRGSAEKLSRTDEHVQVDEADYSLEDVEEDRAVKNAGVVLLYPFFEGLFKNLGLLEEGRFSSDLACERAVCLLHYLATGTEEFGEPDLILAKFLCGWPLEQTINRFLPVSEYEKEECTALLRSAIKHWDVLKNTSIEGLRSNFLQRKGILKEEAFGWSLYLEDATQDILLEKLPWSLSVIKCTWMDEMLTVNWA